MKIKSGSTKYASTGPKAVAGRMFLDDILRVSRTGVFVVPRGSGVVLKFRFFIAPHGESLILKRSRQADIITQREKPDWEFPQHGAMSGMR